MLEPLWQGLPPLDPADVSNAASCALPARHEAVREARRFTRRTLDQWGVRDRADDVCLVASELVTNALRHGLPHLHHPLAGGNQPTGPCTPASGADPGEQGPPVRLHLLHWTGRLVCAVRDPGRDGPVARETDALSAESGRGLFLVESFSDGWGWYPTSGALGGKVVWALFHLPTAE